MVTCANTSIAFKQSEMKWKLEVDDTSGMICSMQKACSRILQVMLADLRTYERLCIIATAYIQARHNWETLDSPRPRALVPKVSD